MQFRPRASVPGVDLGPRELGPVTSVVLGASIGALAAGAVAAMDRWFSPDPIYAPLLGAVAIAAWRGGLKGSSACIAAGWGLMAWAATPIEGEEELLRWTAGLVSGVVIALIAASMRRGHQSAVRAAAAEERTRLRVERLQALAAALSAALTVEEVARVMVESAPAALGASGGVLGLVEGDELVIVGPQGMGVLPRPPGTRLPLSMPTTLTTAAREGRPAWAQHREELERRFPATLEAVPEAAGSIGLPIFVGERLAGAMGAIFTAPNVITDEVRTVARIAADLGGQALERAGLYELERSSREALDRIIAVAPRFQQDVSTKSVAVSVAAEARRAFGCDIVQVWAPVDDEVLEMTWRDPPSDLLPPGVRMAWDDYPGLREEMLAFRSMFVPDTRKTSRGEALRYATRLGVVTSLRIPIVVGGELERILALQWDHMLPEPAPAVMAVMRRFADQAGLAIEQAERRRAQEQTRALQAVTEALSAAATPVEVGRAVAREGMRAVGASAISVYALSEDGDELELVAAESRDEAELEGRRRIPLDADLSISRAVSTSEMVVCSSQEEIAAFLPGIQAPEGSCIVVPLVAGGRAVGGVVIGSRERVQDGDTLPLVIALAGQAAQALDRAQLFERERASAGRLLKLQAVTAALSQAVTLEDVSRACLDHALTGVGAEEGLVVLADPDAPVGQHLRVIATIGIETASADIPAAASGPIAEATRWGRPSASRQGWIAVPLASGALALHRRSPRPLTAADRDWLGTLVSQGAQALDRAGRYETERAIAETMQRVVMPERLPRVSGLTLAARYLPGTVGVDVGGDWYDVFQLDGGRIGLVVGDVVGKGVQAAAMMGQLRNALRALAFEHDDPCEVVYRLDRLVERTMDGAFATLVYLVIDTYERNVRYVVSGHPPPLVRSEDGATTFLDGGRSLPIGVEATLAVEAGMAQIEPGSTIVLYTDGLVERPGAPLDEGLEALEQATSVSEDDPGELVDSILAALVGERERPDDIALLAVRFAAAVVDDLALVLPSSPEGLIEMRNGLRAWLGRAHVGAEDAVETILAVWEACANAVEHAQRPSGEGFTLSARLDDSGRMWFRVRDSGQWKPGDGTVGRGLGLSLMRSLMDDVQVRRSGGGTEVIMERKVHLVNLV